MKNISTLKQSGFFDLGFSLLILAMSGIAMYLTAPDEDGNNAARNHVQIVEIGRNNDN